MISGAHTCALRVIILILELQEFGEFAVAIFVVELLTFEEAARFINCWQMHERVVICLAKARLQKTAARIQFMPSGKTERILFRSIHIKSTYLKIRFLDKTQINYTIALVNFSLTMRRQMVTMIPGLLLLNLYIEAFFSCHFVKFGLTLCSLQG